MKEIQKKRWQDWIKSAFQPIKDDLKLRKMLMPIRKLDLSSKVKKEDRVGIKPPVFFSSFLLFNASLGTLYFSFQAIKAQKYSQIPLVFCCFVVLAYKLQVEWVSRDIIRKCEASSSDIAYFMRKQLLEQCGQHSFIKSRAKILEEKNKRYEQLYKI